MLLPDGKIYSFGSQASKLQKAILDIIEEPAQCCSFRKILTGTKSRLIGLDLSN
jgi:hypothetical protein